MENDKNKFLTSLIYPALLLLMMWIVKLIEVYWSISFVHLGVLPLKAEGLIGIVTAPFIHENFHHLISNSVPFFLLTLTLFYFYKGIASKVFLLIWFIEGVCVWLSGREAYHIGASGIVYGLAAFLFLSGIVRRDSRLAAITMVIVFMYGSMVWGIFPDFFPGKNVSYEAHLWGLIAGLAFAIYFRKLGPQPVKYSWELEGENEDEDSEEESKGDVYWNAPSNFDDFMFKL